MDLTKIKSGFLTSEFWLTISTFLVNIFVMLGYLSPREADDFVKAVATAFAAISTIIVTVFYLYTRMKIKTTIPAPSTDGQTVLTVTNNENVDPSGLSSNQPTQFIVQ
jgi:hypothetical protein